MSSWPIHPLGTAAVAVPALSAWQVQLLGGFRVRHEAAPVMLPASASRLLAFLCLHDPATRTEVAGTLWPDAPQSRANSNLRTAIWRLQKVHDKFVDGAQDLVGLGAVEVDVHAVERWITAAISPQLAGENPATPPGAGRPLLPTWDEPWLEQPRERLHLLQLQAFESLAARLLAVGRPGEALPYAITAMQSAPLRESANQLMIEIHLRQGNVADALSQFKRYRALLQAELGIGPGLGMTSSLGRFLPAERREARPSPTS